jgi:hypothetical protein
MTGTALPYFMVALLAVIVNSGSAPPMPVSETPNVGFAGSLVVKIRFADSGPVTVGVNVTLIAQVEDAATVPAHTLDVTAKSPRFAPRIAAVYVNGPVPVLDSVTVWGTLALFSGTLPKARLVGAIAANGTAVPKVAVLDHVEVMFAPGVQ